MNIRKLLIIISIAIMCFLPTVISAQEPGETPQPDVPVATPTLEQTVSAEQLEVAVLQAQLETMQEFRQDLIETVWGSLACIGGVLLFLVGFNAFTNFRTFENEKKAFKDEVTSQFSNLEREQERHFSDLKRDQEAALTVQLTALSEQLNKMFESLRQTQEQQVQNGFAEISRQVRSDIDRLKSQIGQNKYELLKIAVGKSLDEDVAPNVVMSYFDMIEHATTHNHPASDFAELLTNVRNYLQQMVARADNERDYIPAIFLPRYRNIMAQVPQEHLQEVKTILNLLNQVRHSTW